MAKGTKGGSVYVEISLEKEQFDKDFKAAGREVAAMQKQLSLEMQRNKVKFEIENVDKNTGWAEKLFGPTVIGKIQQAKKETEFLNTQIGYQKNKVDIAKLAWEGMTSSKGALSASAIKAEQAFLREQTSLAGLKRQLDGTTTSTEVMAGALKTSAAAAAIAVTALATAYATLIKSATAWGNAVNDLVDETGLADEEASRLLGTMQIVGINSDEASAAIAKLTKNVSAAAAAQTNANKAGKESEDVFTKYGIAIKDADGNLLDHSEIIKNIQDVHGEMRDGLKKTAMEMDLFGKSGYKMKDFLDLSREQMDAFGKSIDKAGLALKDSAKYEQFTQKLNLLKLAFQGIAITIVDDDIPALDKFVSKLSETAAWVKENEKVLKDFKDFGATIAEGLAAPFLAMGGMVKKYIEYLTELENYQKKQKEQMYGTTSETDYVQRQMTSAKNLEAATKRQIELTKQKVDLENDLIDAQRSLSDAVMTLQGKTLALQLLNIAREKESWAKKTKDEVAATQWAEEAKRKLYEDTINQKLGAEVAAAKEAIKNNQDVYAAIKKASDERKKDEEINAKAQKAVREYNGIYAPGDTKSTLKVDVLNGTITQLKETVKEWNVTVNKFGQSVLDAYKAPEPVPVTITVTTDVNVNGMDQQSAQQLGEVAAQQIIPIVQGAIESAKTKY